MAEYSSELDSASKQAAAAYEAISSWLDRPISGGEQVPTAELERQVKELRASRKRLFALKDLHGDASDIASAIAANTELYRRIGVTLPEEQ